MSFHSISSLPGQDQLLFNQYGRGPSVPLAYQTITDAFEATVLAYPNIPAVRECFGVERTMSYAELDSRANIIANLLIRDYGVGPGHRVVCVFSRCVEMCAFIMGVLKTGAQYVPIDGAVMVEDSLEYVIRNSGASVVLCLKEFTVKVQRSMPTDGCEAAIVALDASSAVWKTGNTRSPAVNIHPQDGAYVIYTSGTTGRPKGVDCSHENVVNTLTNEPAKLGITPGTNVACILMLGFDMCAWEILGTLVNAGTLNLRGTSRRGGDREIWNTCLSRVDVVISTPAAALKYFPRRADFPNIKTIAVGGEPCPISLAEEWAPHIRFQNICGPTEITILNSAKILQPGRKVTIGKPLPNTTAYILDENLNPVRIGETGLMWVGGLSVSRGYVDLPERTALRYRADKFTMDGRMMFNTGDLARWNEDGELEHLGRQDDQVKIKGVRIELDGVSASVESFPAVEKACALKIDDELWCFYSGSGMIEDDALKTHLATKLNHYARPSKLIRLTSLPINKGGKTDKIVLMRTAAEQAKAAKCSVSEMVQSPPLVHIADQKEPEGPDACEKGLAGKVSVMSSDDDDLVKKETSVVLPDKIGGHGERWIRHKGLNAYRKLFILILSINLAVFIVMASNSIEGLPVNQVATAVAANLLVAVLFRQDYFINLVYWLVTRLPTSTPLLIRRHFARVYHIGGFHAGSAVTATLWWVIFAVQSAIYFVQGSENYPINSPTIGLTFAILALLLLIIGMSWPSVRARIHNQWEWSHRFAGWTALILVWAHLVVSAASLNPSLPLGTVIVRSPAVWLVSVTTLSVALPWLRLRRVNVIVEPLSQHAVRLHFDFASPPPGSAIRISDSPLREWHAFATITDPANGERGFSIVVSRAGDWTGRLIENPPTGGKIWTRGVPASGVLRMAPLFRKIVLVATGSGIGPCLPVLLKKEVPCRVFWSAPNPEKTFGKKILDGVWDSDPEAVIWNTKERGRPDLALEAYKLYKSSGAECVCIISNAAVTAKLVYDLEKRGIPAFGPILDS